MLNSYVAYFHAHSNTVNAGGIFYVGKGTHSRSHWFYKRNPHHTNIVNKYGKDHTLVGNIDCSSEGAVFELEKGLIKCLKRMGVKLTNQTDGGEGFSGGRHTPESKKLISEASLRNVDIIRATNRKVHTGVKRSQETCNRISESLKGSSHSDSTKVKLSIWRSGARWMSLAGKTIQVHRDLVEKYINDGWKFGRVVSKGAI